MCQPAEITWTPMNVRVNATHVVEGRTFVTDGSRHCPSRWQCEPRGDESYADFVRRHLTEHEIFIGFESFEDAQRNLFVWCFYSCLKFLSRERRDHPATHVGDVRVPRELGLHDEDDLEMNTPKAERRYMLPPLLAAPVPASFEETEKAMRRRASR
jgi:hypothetical protein